MAGSHYAPAMTARFFEHYPPAPGTVVEARDVDLGALQDRRIAVIGFGTMGRAQAHNLRRSGLDVLVGLRPQSRSGGRAAQEGFPVAPVADAAAQGDVVMLMVPDQAMGRVFADEVGPRLRPGAALGFAHGFAVAFGQILPPPGLDCFLVAPKGQGDMLMAAHAQGAGVPGLLAVTDGSAPATWDLAAAYAKAVGCLHGGGFVTTFVRECVSDQFGEQAVLCGGVLELVKAAFAVMVEAGYGRENAYFECVHELKLITDLLHRHGIDGLRGRISGTAAYGGLTRGPRLVDERVRQTMKDILKEIESGAFAAEFLARHGDPAAGTDALARAEAQDGLAAAGREFLGRLYPDRHADS